MPGVFQRKDISTLFLAKLDSVYVVLSDLLKCELNVYVSSNKFSTN